MESLRGPINSPFFLGGEEDMECLEPAVYSGGSSSSSAVEMGGAASYLMHIPFLKLLRGAMQAGGLQQKEEPFQEDDLLLMHQLCGSCVTTTNKNHNAAAGEHREKKKRKRPRPAVSCKSPEEVESQRMTHIAVERNRRRLMNEHLAALRSLMPPSYVQRGDQASVVGGAIDFVKELEQLLLSLQAEKRLRAAAAAEVSLSPARPDDEVPPQGFFISPQYTSYSREGDGDGDGVGVDVEATVVQGHVNLKVVGPRRQGQLVRAVAALEELRLTVLHLNATSFHPASVLYSLNLKMEEECKLGSADGVAAAAHQIFCYINGS